MESLDVARLLVLRRARMRAALALAFVVALTVPLDHLEYNAMVCRFPALRLSAAVVPTVRRRRFLPTGDRGHAAGGPLPLYALGNLAGLHGSHDAT